jgi:hypothetical protein
MIAWLRRLLHWHRWVYRGDLRRCGTCARVERMEDDVGGWTAAQWNAVDPSAWPDEDSR